MYKLRQAIALEAARLMYERVETEYFTAKRKAAKRLCRGSVKPDDLPSNAEIRDQIQLFARLHEGDKRTAHLRDMRLAALRLMRLLRPFRPRLIGSVMTGHVRKGSDIDIHVFTDSAGLVTDMLENEGYQFDVERKQVVKHGEARVFTHIHVYDRFNFELTVYAEDKAHYVFKSSITGKAIERASIARAGGAADAPNIPTLDLDADLKTQEVEVDPYAVFRMLLLPLENVKQIAEVSSRRGRALPLAAGLRAGPRRSALRRGVPAGGAAARRRQGDRPVRPRRRRRCRRWKGCITERTQFLIEHHMDAQAYKAGTLGARVRRCWKRRRTSRT